MVIKLLQVFIFFIILALEGISQPLMVYRKHLISTKHLQEPNTIVHDNTNATNDVLRGQILSIDLDRYAIKVSIGTPP